MCVHFVNHHDCGWILIEGEKEHSALVTEQYDSFTVYHVPNFVQEGGFGFCQVEGRLVPIDHGHYAQGEVLSFDHDRWSVDGNGAVVDGPVGQLRAL